LPRDFLKVRNKCCKSLIEKCEKKKRVETTGNNSQVPVKQAPILSTAEAVWRTRLPPTKR